MLMSKQRSLPPVASYGLGSLLFIAAKRWVVTVDDRLAPLALSATKYTLLCAIDAAPKDAPLTQRMIADMTSYDVMLVSTLISKLEHDGIVERGQHPTDVRAHAIMLTDKGASVLKKAHKQVEKAERAFFADSSAPEKIRKMLSPLVLP
jgi:DNA-binding MarR family transcriptional regulator